jgi:hypothetical protein
MPGAQPPAKYICLLLATCACDLATQLMPAAHKQPLLLAVQRKGKRGGKSATQRQQVEAQGGATGGATGR